MVVKSFNLTQKDKSCPFALSDLLESLRIVAHGNSLRALMMYLENISEDDIAQVDLPTYLPRQYTLNDRVELPKVVCL